MITVACRSCVKAAYPINVCKANRYMSEKLKVLRDKVYNLKTETETSLRTPTVPRKWYISYGTSSCITYFKLKEHLKLIK